MSTKKRRDRFSNSVRIDNRRARFEYEIIEKYEAGIQLTGNEVKSLRQGTAALTDAYASSRNSELWLKGMHIKPYEEGDAAQDPIRDRKLLLKRGEIDRLAGVSSQQGLTLVPLQVYFNERGLAKVEIGLCRGKKTHDKRATIKERDVQREMRREYKLR